jgi:hypothetical protein
MRSPTGPCDGVVLRSRYATRRSNQRTQLNAFDPRKMLGEQFPLRSGVCHLCEILKRMDNRRSDVHNSCCDR